LNVSATLAAPRISESRDGIAFIDLDTDAINLGIGPNPMLIVSRWLDY